MDIFPNGPSILTTGLPATAEPLAGGGGGITLKVTSGGMDNTALPIWEFRHVDAEKDREAIGNAGRRNEGIDTEGADVRTWLMPLDRAVDNMVGGLLLFCR